MPQIDIATDRRGEFFDLRFTAREAVNEVELDRSYRRLRETGPAPVYFLAYRVDDSESVSVSATLGALDGRWRQPRWRTLEVDLWGPVICSRCVLPAMIARRRGRIVNIASGGGATMFPYFSAYVTAKTALIRFSECLAAEVAAQGVGVFAMSPGTVRTAMSEHSLTSPEGQRWIPWFRRIFDEGLDLPAKRRVDHALGQCILLQEVPHHRGHHFVPAEAHGCIGPRPARPPSPTPGTVS